jgi:hypothetical protein
MAKEIVHYEVTNGYGDIAKGFRFAVEKDNTANIDFFIRKALQEEGFKQIPSALSMLKLKEV